MELGSSYRITDARQQRSVEIQRHKWPKTGGCALSSKDYREFADECLGWAKSARSDRERRVFLEMAESWLKAADLADRRRALAAARQRQCDGAEA
jgi:hypothetical protein